MLMPGRTLDLGAPTAPSRLSTRPFYCAAPQAMRPGSRAGQPSNPSPSAHPSWACSCPPCRAIMMLPQPPSRYRAA